MEDEEFLQCLCNTGLKLNENGKTVEELKLMVIKRELSIVEVEDREFYNFLPEALRYGFDKCKASKEEVQKWKTDWFSEGKVFDPKEFDPETFTHKYSLYFQGFYKKNPFDFILGVIKGEIKVDA